MSQQRRLVAAPTLPGPMLTFNTKRLSTGANGQKEDAASLSFDRAVMQAPRDDLRLETQETRVRTLHWASNDHVTTP